MHIGTPKHIKKAAWIIGGIGAVIVIGIFVASLAKFSGTDSSGGAAGLGLVPRMILLGVLLTGLGFIPKLAGRTFLAGFGVFFLLVGLIVLFLFPGILAKPEKRAEQVEAMQAVAQTVPGTVEEFTLNAGEEKPTVLVGPGSWYRIQANKAWEAVCMQSDGTFGICHMSTGFSTWQVRREETGEGFLLARGLDDGTTLRFERVR